MLRKLQVIALFIANYHRSTLITKILQWSSNCFLYFQSSAVFINTTATRIIALDHTQPSHGPSLPQSSWAPIAADGRLTFCLNQCESLCCFLLQKHQCLTKNTSLSAYVSLLPPPNLKNSKSQVTRGPEGCRQGVGPALGSILEPGLLPHRVPGPAICGQWCMVAPQIYLLKLVTKFYFFLFSHNLKSHK